MSRIVYENQHGGVVIVTPVINTMPERENITEEQALQRAISKLPPEAVNYVVLDESAIPVDRTYRSAWVLSPDKQSVVVDSSKIAPPAPAPTKEQLMAQLAALSAQIQALE
jgi:hypothetical protein